MTLQVDSTLNLNGDAVMCIHCESLCVRVCVMWCYKMYSMDKKKEGRNKKHVFVSDEELEEETRVLEKARKKRWQSWQRRCMKLQIFRIPMDRYASPSAYGKNLPLSSDLNMKYEPALIISESTRGYSM